MHKLMLWALGSVSITALLAVSAHADPVVTPIVVTALIATGSVAIGASTVTAAAIAVATTAIAAGASYLLRPAIGSAPAAADPGAAAAPANGQRTIPVAQSIPFRRMAFGNCRTGGVLFFQDNANPNLYVGTLLTEGPIEAVDAVYFGDVQIPITTGGLAASGSAYLGRFAVEYGLGDATAPVASPTLLAAFPSQIDASFKQTGIARAVARLDWGADSTQHNALWGSSISPNYSGRWLKVYDPRDGTQSVSTPSTWKYSANPALCVAHVLRSAWNVAIPHAAIDYPSVAAAASVCDALVTYGRASVKVFELAGIFQGGASYGAQMQDMLSSFGGSITYRGGKYYLRADAPRSSVWTVTDDDVIELGEYQFGTEARAKFNAISAKYFDAADNGSPKTTMAYEIAADVAAKGLRETSISLPFTPGGHSAQILAYRELMKSRDGRALSANLTDAALFLTPGDVITLALAEASFLNGAFEVVEVDAAAIGAIVTLRGYTPAAYDNPATYLV